MVSGDGANEKTVTGEPMIRVRINVELQQKGFKPDVTIEVTAGLDALPSPFAIGELFDKLAERAIVSGREMEKKVRDGAPLTYHAEELLAWLPMTPKTDPR